MILKEIQPFDGQHCETTATGTLLREIGVYLSEPMLFGLGEGLGFIYWKMKGMDFPFIGGRTKPDLLTANLCRNLGLTLSVQETGSRTKAWTGVRTILDSGRPVGLKLDCFHLDYFENAIHFAGHYVALYGYDETNAYLVDTRPQGGRVRTSLESLARARAERGPMSSKNLYYTVKRGRRERKPDVAIRSAIARNAREFLKPPIANFGYKGILRAGTEVQKWFRGSSDPRRDFCTTALLMERAGTGGALFRNFYRDFLLESARLLRSEPLRVAADRYRSIAEQWTEVADLFDRAGKTGLEGHIERAATLLVELSDREQRALLPLTRI